MFALPTTSTAPSDFFVFLVCSVQAARARWFVNHDQFDESAHGGIPYTDDEVAILLAHYVQHGIDHCQKMMPRHTRHSIIRKARRLGIKKWERREWTPREEDIIRACIKCGDTLATISATLHQYGFERTPVTIRDFISSRGLR